ncbi:MAG: 23S rRNA (cytidine(2498)-2'-O)-methyltransferase RlmM [Burkholderiales bacterium]|nr:23S rRNA (cytidine(2498)-2'-O)-methyltransferase RlmM [Burkholderiales bacterium]
MTHSLLLYCRAGFEGECAAETVNHCTELGVSGFAKAKPDSGYVLFTPHDADLAKQLVKFLHFEDLVFARQLIFNVRLVDQLPATDRVTPLIAAIRDLGDLFSAVWLETADTNDAKEMSTFCRKFAPPLTYGLKQAGLLDEQAHKPRLHLFWLSSSAVYLGVSYPNNASPWPMGIPRLKLSRDAPSRSTLKLAEAFMAFLSEEEEQELLHPGISAVDLGAAPGGWTWQLVQRGVNVAAVDNAAIDPKLLDTNLVEHVRADGFHYWPKRSVEWLVCDMVEKPARITQLVTRWIYEGKCQHAIFNLKLPMKKRSEELARCRELIDAGLQGKKYQLQFKQLYHDREEVTGYLTLKRR